MEAGRQVLPTWIALLGLIAILWIILYSFSLALFLKFGKFVLCP
jgi:hypothetical protein